MGAAVEFFPEEGVHLNLPEDLYFAADALGSSDLKTLLRDPATWWYSSRHNPQRQIKDSKKVALRKGNALHTLILEGAGAYERKFAVEPDESEHPDAARTVSDIKRLLERNGVTPPATHNKEANIAAAKKAKLGHLVWDVIWHSYTRATESGKAKVTQREDVAFRHMAELVHQHPKLGPALAGGLTEVSIFWRRDDDPNTLLRCRLDKLLRTSTADLKTLSNWKAQSTRHATVRQITEFEYDIQRRFYDEPRKLIGRFLEEGRVFAYDNEGVQANPTRDEFKILREVAKVDRWLWAWIFYQVRSDEYGKERAPVLIPWFHEPQGQMWDQAGEKIERALKNFRDYRERYGFEMPWAEIGDVAEIQDSDLGSLLWKGLPE